MSIQPIAAQGVHSVAGTAPTTMASPPPSPHLRGTLNPIAQTLGMSVSSIQAALTQGSSISGLAAQAGVARQSLVTQVYDQIQQRRSSLGLSPQDPATLNTMINRAFDRALRSPTGQ